MWLRLSFDQELEPILLPPESGLEWDLLNQKNTAEEILCDI